MNPTTPSANPVQSIAIPSPLRASGSASSTGYLSLSNNGTYLAFDTANTTNTTTNTNTILSRSVGTLDLNGNFAISASYTGANGNQPRGATSIDDSTWVIGDQGGIYVNNATTPTPAGNFRATKAFGGTVYTLTASGTATNVVVDTVSISGSGAVTGLPGLTNDAAAVDFTLVSSGANGSAYDVLYITDDTSATVGAIKKFALIGGTWTAEGTATTTGMFGIAAAKDPVAGFDLYATTGNGSSGSNSVQVRRQLRLERSDLGGHGDDALHGRDGNEPQGNRLRPLGRGDRRHRLVVNRRHGCLRHGRQLHRHDHERRQPRHLGQRPVLGRRQSGRRSRPCRRHRSCEQLGDQQLASDRQSACRHGELPRRRRRLPPEHRNAVGRPVRDAGRFVHDGDLDRRHERDLRRQPARRHRELGQHRNRRRGGIAARHLRRHRRDHLRADARRPDRRRQLSGVGQLRRRREPHLQQQLGQLHHQQRTP